MDKVNLAEKFDRISEMWSPRIAAELNGQHLKLAKLRGEFVWHSHREEDELFLVVKGELELHLRGQVVILQAGEFFVVPKGVEHRPVAEREVQVLLLEPKSTVNTGDGIDSRTKTELEWV